MQNAAVPAGGGDVKHCAVHRHEFSEVLRRDYVQAVLPGEEHVRRDLGRDVLAPWRRGNLRPAPVRARKVDVEEIGGDEPGGFYGVAAFRRSHAVHQLHAHEFAVLPPEQESVAFPHCRDPPSRASQPDAVDLVGVCRVQVFQPGDVVGPGQRADFADAVESHEIRLHACIVAASAAVGLPDYRPERHFGADDVLYLHCVDVAFPDGDVHPVAVLHYDEECIVPVNVVFKRICDPSGYPDVAEVEAARKHVGYPGVLDFRRLSLPGRHGRPCECANRRFAGPARLAADVEECAGPDRPWVFFGKKEEKLAAGGVLRQENVRTVFASRRKRPR